MPTAADACDASVTILPASSITPGSCPDSYTITRSWTATDDCGNSTVAVQVITVIDTQAPLISGVPNDVTVQCNAVPMPAQVSATDNCDATPTVTFNQTSTPGSCADNYTLTRTWTATDNCGNSTVKTQLVTVVDTQAPTFNNPPANITVQCNNVPPPPVLTASDNCDPTPTITAISGIVQGSCADSYFIQRSWTATDRCGNSTSVSQTVTVIDTQAPMINGVPNDITVQCNAVPMPAQVSATDNCDATPTLTFNETTTPGTCADSYTITRTWTATDNCSNTTTKIQVITVIDTQAPTLIGVPANVTVQCNAVPAPANPSATDNCDATPTITFGQTITPGNCPDAYTITRTWMATDNCGNTSTQTQLVTVIDTQAPTLIGVPANVTVECNAVPAPANPSATDNCDQTPTITFSQSQTPGSCPQSYTITRTWMATDNCGNTSTATQTVTVRDTQAPILTAAPANVTVECDAVPAPATLQASDNCDTNVPVIFTQTITPGNCAGNYTITRVWTATDDCGNSASRSQVITVRDTQAPVFTVNPSSQTVQCGPNNNAQFNAWYASRGGAQATDNCSGVNWTSTFVFVPGCGNTGVYTATFTATDGCGNSASRTATFTIIDTQAPTITVLPASVTVECDPAGGDSGFQTWYLSNGGAQATDQCGGVTWLRSVVFVPGCGNTGVYTATFRAVDECGNQSAPVTATYTIVDTQAPEFVVPPLDVNVDCNILLNPEQFQDWLDSNGGAEISDCNEVTWLNDYNPMNWWNFCGETKKIDVRFTAVDACGNSAYRVATFMVVDFTAPEWVTPPQNITIECTDMDGLDVQIWDYLDNHGYGSVIEDCSTIDWETDLLCEIQNCGNARKLIFQFKATDHCGNQSIATGQIMIVDNTPPTIIECPAGDPFLTCVGDIPAPNPGAVIALDECSSVTVTHTSTQVDGTGCGNWPMNLCYVYTAVDACGNESVCLQSFTVYDTIAPTMGLPSNITVNCVDDIPGPTVFTQLVRDASAGQCSGITGIMILADSGEPQLPDSTRTYTFMIKDACSNKAGPFTVTYTAVGNCKPLCTAPQSTWSDPDGGIGDEKVSFVIDSFLTNYGMLTAGRDGYSINIMDVECLQELLPAEGSCGQLSAGDVMIDGINCAAGTDVLNQDGNLENMIAANVMIIELNLWFNATYNLRDLGIQNIQDLPACLVPFEVQQQLGKNKVTIQDLVDLANDYLASEGYYPVGFGDLLNTALLNLNLYWENCGENNPCKEENADKRQDVVDVFANARLFPNPATHKTILTFESQEIEEVTVRVTSLNGGMYDLNYTTVKGWNNLEVPVKDLPSGIYWITLSNKQGVKTLRLAVESGTR